MLICNVVDHRNDVAALMTRVFNDRLDSITGYSWGAPLIANAGTRIWEYEIAHPNAVREALLLGEPRKLWVADVAANRMIAVDVATGKQQATLRITSKAAPQHAAMNLRSITLVPIKQ